jgi:hypothetical protein
VLFGFATILYRVGIEFTKKNVVRGVLIALSVPTAIMVFLVIVSMPSISKSNLNLSVSDLFSFIEWAATSVYSIFAPIYLFVLLIHVGSVAVNSRFNINGISYWNPWEQFKVFRKQVIQDWGFSGHLFDAILWTGVSLMFLIAFELTRNLTICLFLLAFSLFPLRNLGYALVQYSLNPVSYKRINVAKISGVINRLFKIDVENSKPAILLVSLLITVSFLFMFWFNYSVLVLSFRYAIIYNPYPNAISDYNINVFDWLYETFQLAINGNFNLNVDLVTKLLLTPLSLSNFIFLTLFFSQVISNFSDLGKEKPE